MIAVQNDHVNRLDNIVGRAFKELYVCQILEARDSVFQDMSKELIVTNHYHIICRHVIPIEVVTKKELIGRLEIAYLYHYIPDLFSVTVCQKMLCP